MLIAKYSHERFDNIGYYFHNHCETVSVHINKNYYIRANDTKCSMRKTYNYFIKDNLSNYQ